MSFDLTTWFEDIAFLVAFIVWAYATVLLRKIYINCGNSRLEPAELEQSGCQSQINTKWSRQLGT